MRRMTRVDRVQNPYRPGFNQAPATLSGRADVIEDLIDALEVAAIDGRTPPPVLMIGPRGVGKTVMLGELADMAGSRYGWMRAHVEVRPGTPFTPDLVASVLSVRSQIEQGSGPGLQAESATLRAQVAGVGGEVHFARPPVPDDEPALVLRHALTSLVQIAVEHGTGVVLTLDEVQLASREELAGLAALLQHATGDDWPIVTAGAGLPLMRDPDHAVTYFERATWHELGLLDGEATIEALTGPADRAGRPLDPAAADVLAVAAGGYPYAIQVYGHFAWRASDGEERITLAAAQRGSERARRSLAQGLYAGRWSGATEAQRQYLKAVARLTLDGLAVTGRAVADEVGRTTKQLSSVRADLLRQGTLTVAGDELRFTVPGMAEYVGGQEARGS